MLVNNAGHGYWAAVEESEPEKIAELFDTNFFAPADLMKMVLPVMRRQRSGVIINVTSIGAVRGALGNGYYSAAKGALELLTEALANRTSGDPEKGGKVIVETVLSGRLPFRLLLGSDAASAAEEVLEGRLQELRKWRDVSHY